IEQQFQQLLDSADPAMTGPPRAIESGFTARQIIEYAATNNYDYIVMGAKGTSNRIAELYGSNTIQVASQSPCPLIVVPPTARFRPIASIAFATAYDKKERQVHAGLQQLAATLGASIHYVNVNTKTTSHKAESSVLIENHPHADADLWIINDPSIKNGLETFIGQKKIDLLVVFKTPKNLWQWLTQSGTTRKMMLNPTIPLVVLSGASRFGK
ncbi:MAG: universal stress protein, partial [Bacteroidota bacterium]